MTLSNHTYDVLICGAGLAGLTLAIHLKKDNPSLRILLVDPRKRPFPKGCYKVGESTVDISANYFSKTLGFKNYLQKNHLPKLGLHYFFGGKYECFEKRPEIGASDFTAISTYQIDRGLFETDLRIKAIEMDINLAEGYSVLDIQIAQDETGHQITVQNVKSQEIKKFNVRWLVDASGRRRMIQRQMNLNKESDHAVSAAWFRISKKISVSDFVSSENKKWHQRLKQDRYLATNHLLGEGYWVWLIPLSSGQTSIGIVASEKNHPFSTYGINFETAIKWLEKYEPCLADIIKQDSPDDFMAEENYSYLSKKIYSFDRWACIGEAACFLDPFYSPGSDLITITNHFTKKMIELDFENKLDSKIVKQFNQLNLGLLESWLLSYKGMMSVYGHPNVMPLKIAWDNIIYTGFIEKLVFSELLFSPEMSFKIAKWGVKFAQLHEKAQKMFQDAAGLIAPKNITGYFDAKRLRILMELQEDLLIDKTDQEIIKSIDKTITVFEDALTFIFLELVKQLKLEGYIKDINKINPYAINLDAKAWDESFYLSYDRKDSLGNDKGGLADGVNFCFNQNLK